jgi:hypothetical protein
MSVASVGTNHFRESPRGRTVKENPQTNLFCTSPQQHTRCLRSTIRLNISAALTQTELPKSTYFTTSLHTPTAKLLYTTHILPTDMALPNRAWTKLAILPLPPSYTKIMSASAISILVLTSVNKLKLSPLRVMGVGIFTTVFYACWDSLKLRHLTAELDVRLEEKGACRDCRSRVYEW